MLNPWPECPRLPKTAASILAVLHLSHPRVEELSGLTENEWREALAYCDRSRLTLALGDAARNAMPQWVRERIESLTSALRRYSDPNEKLVALRTHYAELAKDRRLVLISLEFKLFALRHPEAHARLRSRHRRIRASFGELFSEVMGAIGKNLPIAYPAASACLGAVSQGLLLEHLLDPKTLSDGDVRNVLGLYFDSIFSGCRHVD